VSANSGLPLDPTTPLGSANFDAKNRLNSATWVYDAAGNQKTTGPGSLSNTYDAEKPAADEHAGRGDDGVHL